MTGGASNALTQAEPLNSGPQNLVSKNIARSYSGKVFKYDIIGPIINISYSISHLGADHQCMDRQATDRLFNSNVALHYITWPKCKHNAMVEDCSTVLSHRSFLAYNVQVVVDCHYRAAIPATQHLWQYIGSLEKNGLTPVSSPVLTPVSTWHRTWHRS